MDSVGGYSFKNKSLIKTALTHSSFSSNNYERLEFLGDSILNFVIADYFFSLTEKSQGDLTKIRAFYVSKLYLCKIFDKLNLVNALVKDSSFKSVSNSIKCDVIEAIIGAIYLDGGLKNCQKFIKNNFELNDSVQLIDYKTKLQEWAQQHKQNVKYIVQSVQGKPHKPTFYVVASVGGYTSTCSAETKQKAEQNSAKQILDQISKGV